MLMIAEDLLPPRDAASRLLTEKNLFNLNTNIIILSLSDVEMP